MQFSVFALSSVPDTATTRQLFSLNDLDDKSVAKVMFHRRKQQTGASEELRWDQRAIASLTLIHHSSDGVQMDSMNLARQSEQDMLHAYFKTALDKGRTVSWGGAAAGMPLLHFRALMHEVSYPAYWQALRTVPDMHLDVREWLSPPSTDLPALNETSRKLGFPGLLNKTENDAMDAWLKGEQQGVQVFSDIAALSIYLLALRLFSVVGDLAHHEYAQAQGRLRDSLRARDEYHLAEFLSAWGET